MEMCFHGNQLSWAIKHPFISLCFKYHSPGFICFSTVLAPVISSLDEIYCTLPPVAEGWTKQNGENHSHLKKGPARADRPTD